MDGGRGGGNKSTLGHQCSRRQPMEQYCWIQWIGFLAHRNGAVVAEGENAGYGTGAAIITVAIRDDPRVVCSCRGKFRIQWKCCSRIQSMCRHSTPHSHGQHGLRPTPRPPAAGLPRPASISAVRSRGPRSRPLLRAELFRLRSSLVHHISCDERGCVCACVSRSRRRRCQLARANKTRRRVVRITPVRVGSVGRRVRTLVAPMGHTQSSCHLSPSSKYAASRVLVHNPFDLT